MQKAVKQLMKENPNDKVEKMLAIFRDAKVDKWAEELKEQYYVEAMKHLEAAAVLSKRKEPLKELAKFLLMRDH